MSQPRFLADENVPLEAVRGLQADGHDVVPVLSVCPGAPDEEVLALGAAQQRVVITFDRDFGELVFRRRLPTPSRLSTSTATSRGYLPQARRWLAVSLSQPKHAYGQSRFRRLPLRDDARKSRQAGEKQWGEVESSAGHFPYSRAMSRRDATSPEVPVASSLSARDSQEPPGWGKEEP